MRTAFFETLEQLAEKDHRIHLIVGDVGYGAVSSFYRRFPSRFLNAGVAEQHMIGVATGMALSGKIVFVYSLANFPVLRCVEQIRNDVCYHHANVKIVSVGAGLSYGSLGMTHHATEDVAVMRAMPGMMVVSPGDPLETKYAVRALAEHQGPAYLRLGRTNEPVVHPGPITFSLGSAIHVRAGNMLTLIATGTMMPTAVRAAEVLDTEGISVRLLSMHTISPLDGKAVLAAARATSAIATLEEHSIVGGLGSAVAEVLAESGELHVPFRRLGLPPQLSSHVGSQEYLRGIYSLSLEGVLESIQDLVRLIGR
jgi:transketolase